MSKTALEQWDETNANNTDVGSINIDEGCAPSGMNNAAREQMAQIAKWLGDDTLASAATTDLGSVPGRSIDVSGTTTITAFGTIKAGTIKVVRFTGALTLTHNATSLILYSGLNITTYSGLVMTFRSLGSGNWIEVSQTPASGSWTVNPTFGGAAVGLTGTFVGSYHKHGKRATVTAVLTFTAKGSSTGVLRLDTIPFLAAAAPASWSGTVSPIANGASLVAGMGCYILAGQNVIFLVAPITTGTTPVTDVNITNTTALTVTITYETA